jgi:prepilin-type N-terminal cleavage/methylation domain-containing protein
VDYFFTKAKKFSLLQAANGISFRSIMKTLLARAKNKGLTLFEVLVVIAVVVVLAAILLPAIVDRNSKHPGQMMCMSNQKQIALGFIMWNSDNGNQFPWLVSMTNGGSMEAADRGYAAANFVCLSNYLRATPVFVCPSDTNKATAADFTRMNNLNLSYFVSVDAATNATDSILSGDRHLAANGKPVKTGLFINTPGSKMSWTHEFHNANPATTFGVISFEDGHAQVVKNADLNPTFLHESLATNRLDIP